MPTDDVWLAGAVPDRATGGAGLTQQDVGVWGPTHTHKKRRDVHTQRQADSQRGPPGGVAASWKWHISPPPKQRYEKILKEYLYVHKTSGLQESLFVPAPDGVQPPVQNHGEARFFLVPPSPTRFWGQRVCVCECESSKRGGRGGSCRSCSGLHAGPGGSGAYVTRPSCDPRASAAARPCPGYPRRMCFLTDLFFVTQWKIPVNFHGRSFIFFPRVTVLVTLAQRGEERRGGGDPSSLVFSLSYTFLPT